MSKGISNTEIEKSFKEINNDLNEYFLGVYPSDKRNKFVVFEKMIPGKYKIYLLGFKHGLKQPRQDALMKYNQHFAKK